MSLATRCTSCGTIFRVVQDQLKVSDGWVRCGRCDAVFSAANELFDPEREAPPDWQPPAAPLPVPPVPSAAPIGREDGSGGSGGFASDDERRWSEAMASQQVPVATADVPEVASRPASGSVQRNVDDDADSGDLIVGAEPAIHLVPHAADGTGEPLLVPHDAVSAAAPAPGFLRQARREAVWRSRRTRVLLGSAAVLLIALLALQTLQQFSELTAARWPALRPTLVAWCGLTGCSLGPPHRIDDIVVESTALSPASTGLRLAVTLRNRATYPVAVPSIDLSITDMTGKLIARRALSPRDLSVVATAIEAGSDLPLQAQLTAGAERVSGYTVEIFYP